MDSINLLIADFSIQILFKEIELPKVKEGFKKHVKKNYGDFIVPTVKKPLDFTIEFIWDDQQETIVREKEKKYYINLYRYKGKKKIQTYYQISFYHFNMILRDVLHILLLQHEGFMLHASASLVSGANIFIGKSGAGKSTSVNLLSKKYKRLADDAVILKKVNNKFVLFQTPFMEKNYISHKLQSSFPINKIYFVKKSKIFKEEKINDTSIIFNKLLEQTFLIKRDKRQVEILMDFIKEKHNFFYLYFAKNEKAMLNFFNNDN